MRDVVKLDIAKATAAAMSQMLMAGTKLSVAGYFLDYDEKAGILWFTNPYGCDGCLGEVPQEPVLENFLGNIRAGLDYGPVPH